MRSENYAVSLENRCDHAAFSDFRFRPDRGRCRVRGIRVAKSPGIDSIVESDDLAQLHANRQFRRRMQVSVMLGIIGLLIALGDQLDQLFAKRPLYFLMWVASVILLTFWMVLMALGDWLSTMTYSEIAKARLRFERRELESQIRQYHASNNGHPLSDTAETE